MTVDNFIIFILTNIFRISVNTHFLEVFLEKKDTKEDRFFRVITVLACIAVTSIGYVLFRNVNINILTNVIGLFITTITFEGGIKKRCLAVSVTYFLNMICDIIVITIFVDYLKDPEFNELWGTVTVLWIVICEVSIERGIYRKKKTNFMAPYCCLLLIIPLFSIAMMWYLISTSLEERGTVILIGGGLLIVNMISLFLYCIMEEAYTESMEKTIIIESSKAYKKQLDIIMEGQEQLRSLQHDLKYHIRELLAMADNKNMQEMVAYLEEMEKETKNPNELVYSGNQEIDGNLNYLLGIAKKKLKDVSVKVVLPEAYNISFFDINIMLSNLLDNAVTAAECSEEQYLRVEVEVKKSLLYITVENSYCGLIREENGKFFTIKRNKELHGYGLKNVKRVVDKYNGTMEIRYSDQRFIVDIMLYLLN